MATARTPEVSVYKDACISCTACYEICPTDVFTLDEQRKPEVKYAEDCQACFMCEFICPTAAIRVMTYRWLAAEQSE